MIHVHICESYGREYDVKFNTQITHLVVCDYLNKYINMSSLTLIGETIIRQRIASHLDHVVGVDSHNITIRHAVNDLTWRTKYMLSKFASCNSQVKTRLFEHSALIIMAVFYGGLIQMVYNNFMLLGEIVLGKFGRFHGVHTVTWSNIYMAD